jgi:hypothetical protein
MLKGVPLRTPRRGDNLAEGGRPVDPNIVDAAQDRDKPQNNVDHRADLIPATSSQV